ncbi:TetR/AcrR family transcriptional regulator [Allosalinactinospora lopnorensis]|uniref:TetR/AcrR family transcriptional regulator n=1 Tax=Allosalinactinospora lopnorensis TaxID=1352348 RepID=UPI000623CEE4|nr:TetR/AcrR family transcriptional regulator [Allosalinactinospora lopnorensis]
MPIEYSGGGDPARSIELLWGLRERATRGPKPGLTVDRIVTAAVGLADAEGITGLSMRRVAERLGVGAMSLYRYVPGKAELLDLMVDRVSGETDRPSDVPGGWRARLEQVARENRRLYERHPWLLRVFSFRPPLGPGIVAKYDYELRSVEGVGLTDVEMDQVLTLVLGYAREAAAGLVEWRLFQERSGQTDDEWWTAVAPSLEKVFDAERYSVAARVGAASSEYYQGTYDPEQAFEFGLRRVLDGVAALVERDSPC